MSVIGFGAGIFLFGVLFEVAKRWMRPKDYVLPTDMRFHMVELSRWWMGIGGLLMAAGALL